MIKKISHGDKNILVSDPILHLRSNCKEGKFKSENKDAGNWIEIQPLMVEETTLTVLPFYEEEPYIKILGILIDGELKQKYPPNTSELISLGLIRHSLDEWKKLFTEIEREEMVKAIVNNTELNLKYENYMIKLEMLEKTSPKWGKYYIVKPTRIEKENIFGECIENLFKDQKLLSNL